MIRNAKEGQLLAASLAQVSFNAGNAVGAWLGGLPIDAGKAANWAAMPGFFWHSRVLVFFCQLAYSQSARRGTHRWPHRCTSRSDPVKNALAKAYCADCSPPIPNGLGRRILASSAAVSVFRSLTSSRRALRRRALPSSLRTGRRFLAAVAQ